MSLPCCPQSSAAVVQDSPRTIRISIQIACTLNQNVSASVSYTLSLQCNNVSPSEFTGTASKSKNASIMRFCQVLLLAGFGLLAVSAKPWSKAEGGASLSKTEGGKILDTPETCKLNEWLNVGPNGLPTFEVWKDLWLSSIPRDQRTSSVVYQTFVRYATVYDNRLFQHIQKGEEPCLSLDRSGDGR